MANNAIAANLDDVPFDDGPLEWPDDEPLDDGDEPAAMEASDVIQKALREVAAFSLSVAIQGPSQVIHEIAGGVCYLLVKYRIVRDDVFAAHVRHAQDLAGVINARANGR